MTVDMVFTWVNSEDEDLARLRHRYAASEQGGDLTYRTGETRFRDRGELRHSLMTAKAQLPFLRRIYVVHAGTPAPWLKQDNRPTLIHDAELIPPEIYPTFNSDVVEAYPYRIPGLAEQYIYSNDDMFFSRPHLRSDFFTTPGRLRLSVDDRFATMAPVSGTYKEMERNSVRSLQKHLRLPHAQAAPAHQQGLGEQTRMRLQALKRGVRLLNTFTHVAQPFLKSRWIDFHAVFRRELADFTKLRFRLSQGYAINFMYHHDLKSLGDAEFCHEPDHWYINWRDSFEKRRGGLTPWK